MALEFTGPGKGYLPKVSTFVGPRSAPFAVPRTLAGAIFPIVGYSGATDIKANLTGLAFYHTDSNPYNTGFYRAPARWMDPGQIARRPRVAMVCATTPTSSFVNLTLFGTGATVFALTEADIPATLPPDFQLVHFNNITRNAQISYTNWVTDPWAYNDGSPIIGNIEDGTFQVKVQKPWRTDVITYAQTDSTTTLYGVPLPHPWAGPKAAFDPDALGLPTATADLLLVHVGSLYNSWNQFNVDDLIRNKHKFPQYAIRFYRADPGMVTLGLPDLTSYIISTFHLADPSSPAEQAFIAAITADINSFISNAGAKAGGWQSSADAACNALQAAGFDAQVVGNESDATRANVGKVISDYFGFKTP